MAWAYVTGTNGRDFLRSTYSDDIIHGLAGNDLLYDGGRYGQADIDRFIGSVGNDTIYGRWGTDILEGGSGHDVLVSRSDAGEPVIAQNPSLPKYEPGEPLGAANDTLIGGVGADKFFFRLDLNARPEIIAAHTDITGDIDWEGVTGENGAPHLHWVESIGNDTIRDFYRSEGDMIVLKGHTVSIESIVYSDSDGDGRDDTSLVTLRSDQGGAGAHDGDSLGTLRILGDLVTAADIMIDAGAVPGRVETIDDAFTWTNHAATNGNDVLRTIANNAVLNGKAGDDLILDGGRRGQTDRDIFYGGTGNDTIRSRWGNDALIGGDGDDILVSRSDAGEPKVGQIRTNWKIYPSQPYDDANDVMTGGLGADTFYFRFDLQARAGIVSKYVEEDGTIDWHRVAGENGAIHLHWVESIGVDTITDFYRAEGDRIVLEGHTVDVHHIAHVDSNNDGRNDTSYIYVRSNQGATGSHNKDAIGLIKVQGDLVNWSDIVVNSGPTFGVAENIDDYSIL